MREVLRYSKLRCTRTSTPSIVSREFRRTPHCTGSQRKRLRTLKPSHARLWNRRAHWAVCHKGQLCDDELLIDLRTSRDRSPGATTSGTLGSYFTFVIEGLIGILYFALQTIEIWEERDARDTLSEGTSNHSTTIDYCCMLHLLQTGLGPLHCFVKLIHLKARCTSPRHLH